MGKHHLKNCTVEKRTLYKVTVDKIKSVSEVHLRVKFSTPIKRWKSIQPFWRERGPKGQNWRASSRRKPEKLRRKPLTR